ncbi:MAG: glycoside hydrolase family 2 TIM barrel-domain containing protein [Dehalococcoidia bacterium]|nr:glycoside hydrolase family 2 TIM barrel-domain containing protein [Dehalococcoidia bacterium]
MSRRTLWPALALGAMAVTLSASVFLPADYAVMGRTPPFAEAIAVSPPTESAARPLPAEADVPHRVEAEAAGLIPSYVSIEDLGDGSFRYLVNGTPQLFIGMGYNPIYRYLSDAERAEAYNRDFRLMCRAGINHITGWDSDKGYEQDKFDELTLDYADKYGLGVIMPFYLPPDGDYQDEAFTQELTAQAVAKIDRFKNHPALRMWGVGNEVLGQIESWQDRAAFGLFYLQLADLFHALDPNHLVIYREAEDFYIPDIADFLSRLPSDRPWLLYGMNVYTADLERILDDWPSYELNMPIFVTEFGADQDWPGGRSIGYLSMWRMIRAHSEYALGGAPYAWTTAGPEPTDAVWGLMDGESRPVDDTFAQLKADWLREKGTRRLCPR